MKSTLPLIGLALLLAGAVGIGQHRKLERLKSEIASRKVVYSTEPEPASQHTLSAANVPTSDRGEPDLPETTALLTSLAKVRATMHLPPGLVAPVDPDFPEAIRLHELLSGMGLATALRLVDSLPDSSLRDQALYELQNSNPEVAFRVMTAAPDRKLHSMMRLEDCFHAWVLLDSAGAARWFKSAQAGHDEIADKPEILLQAAAAEARIDPARTAKSLPSLLRTLLSHPDQWTPDLIATRFDSVLRNNQERGQFLKGLNDLPNDPVQAKTLADFRKSLLAKLESGLQQDPFPEVSPMIDALYSADERRTFALDLAGRIDPQNELTQPWFAWLATAGLSDGPQNPLVAMVKRSARMNHLGNAAWLDPMPAGTLKNEVITACVEETRNQPELAARYLEKLSDGAEKDRLAELLK